MNKKRVDYLKVVLGLMCMTFLIYIGTTLFQRAKIDFTEERLYTLSKGTEAILAKLDAPIVLRLYYSKTAANKGSEGLRAFNNYYLYVKELLKQYARHGRNNLILEFIDPRPDTVDEEEALAFGLKKFNLTESERYFFGLVAENESGTERVIPFFDPNKKDKLEYALTKLIYTVLRPQKKNIGIISSLKVMSEKTNPYMAQIMRMQGRPVAESWLVVKQLEELFNVSKVENDVEAISGIDTLVIIHPKGFSEKTLFAIDQFLMRGGKLLVFVDPNAVVDREGMGMGRGPKASHSPGPGFKQLMAKWGVKLEANTYAGDKSLSGIGRFSPNRPPGRLLPLLNCNGVCSQDYNDTITAGIKDATFIFPGALTVSEVPNITHTPILATSAKGNSYTAAPYELGNPQALWSKFKEGTAPVVIGYKVMGVFKTAYPKGVAIDEGPSSKGDGKGKKLVVAEKEKQKKKEGERVTLLVSKKESAIILFSDVDFINDQFAFKKSFLGPAPANGNSALFIGAVEALVGDIDLLSVRAKGKMNRSFDVINKIELEAEKRTGEKVKEINRNISRFQAELNQLGRQANEGNIALLQNEGLKKKKALAKKIVLLKKELREVKRAGREKIEGIGAFFKYLNTLFMPILIIIFGIYYHRKRNKLMRRAESIGPGPQQESGLGLNKKTTSSLTEAKI